MHPQNITRTSPVTAAQLVCEARDQFVRCAQRTPGAPWSPSERNYAAATTIAAKLIAAQADRLAIAGRVHNLIGDLEELMQSWRTDAIGELEFAARIEDDVIGPLHAQLDQLKTVAS